MRIRDKLFKSMNEKYKKISRILVIRPDHVGVQKTTKPSYTKAMKYV